MEKLQQQINKCLYELRKVRANNIKAINCLPLEEKTKLYQILKDLNDFDDILIINHLK